MTKEKELQENELETITGGAQTQQQGASLEPGLAESGVVQNTRPPVSDRPSL